MKHHMRAALRRVERKELLGQFDAIWHRLASAVLLLCKLLDGLAEQFVRFFSLLLSTEMTQLCVLRQHGLLGKRLQRRLSSRLHHWWVLLLLLPLLLLLMVLPSLL